MHGDERTANLERPCGLDRLQLPHDTGAQRGAAHDRGGREMTLDDVAGRDDIIERRNPDSAHRALSYLNQKAVMRSRSSVVSSPRSSRARTRSRRSIASASSGETCG